MLYTEEQKIKWIVEQHRSTNHLYDGYLPYEYHLRMTVGVCKRFISVPERQWSELELACWGHDLIEDTRVTYNDVKQVLGEYVADIIYVLTNLRGKNRHEKASSIYYQHIVNTEGAVFVKLCDRIANVEYSKMTGSKMFEMYKKENGLFVAELGMDFGKPIWYMFNHLQELFNT